MSIREEIEALALFDHHCHGIVRDELSWPYFTSLLTEADTAIAGHELDTQLGNFVLTECAEVIGLPRHASPSQYWEQRTTIGNLAISSQLIAASGIERFGMDTGYRGDELTSPQEMADLIERPVDVISRLETMAEDLVTTTSPEQFPDAFRQLLAEVTPTSIGFKSVMAYRFGLDFNPQRPSDTDVIAACRSWSERIDKSGVTRLEDETILRFLLWSAVDVGKPIQMHIGYGDTDINLYRCDPSRMTEFLRLTQTVGTPIVLLHCYPYVRQAGILCQVFPHVWMDTSLGVAHAGFASSSIIRESLEMTPFSRLLFASDAFGLAEIYLAGASLWRRAMTTILDEWVDQDLMSRSRALELAEGIAYKNGYELYRISGVRVAE